ncbi:MAG: RagB/SusD family nutrient uptake outer membrane protein [Bacteroidota bacterium]
MKKILIILFALFTFSCTDLNLKPSDADVDGEIFKEGEAYRSYMAKVYGAYSLTGQEGPHGDGDISIVNDEGFTSYIRAYWKAQELTTDEAVIGWTDAGIRDLNTLSWSSENQFVRVLYYRIFYIIAYANDFMTQSEPEKLDERGISDQWKTEIATYRAEVRFLRAMAYWHALDLFRNVPLLTKISTTLPTQATPAELFAFIENELAEIEPLMVDPMANEYGRADRAALWMLQAKLFLNAEVYINESRYSDVITAVDKITAAGYQLHSNYFELYMADNHNISAPYSATPEVIFALNSDGKNTKNWGNTTFLVHAAIGETMSDDLVDGTEEITGDGTKVELAEECLTNYGVGGGWAGIRTTKSMVAKFGPDPLDVSTMDPRNVFYTHGQNLEIADVGDFQHGYAVPKFVNIDSQGNPGVDSDFPDTDNPIFRLGDAYLMYAEAHLRGGGGDATTALGYINALRQRAYGDNSGDITAVELTLPLVMDERVLEMYWESTRRQDLIRDGKFAGASQEIWPWKGGEMDGAAVEDKYIIFPIPASDLNVNENLKQNDGY